MTITYSLSVGNVHFGGFVGLLLRWKGSVYKLIFRELILYMSMYYSILVFYRMGLDNEQKRKFEMLCTYFRVWSNSVPLNFVLSFYVSLILRRWWEIYNCLPWIDRMALFLNSYLEGTDENGRLLRRTVVRYLNISAVLCLRTVSTAVKKRFPTLEHLVEAKIMTENELNFIRSASTEMYGNYFQPIFWSGTLLTRARNEGRIRSDDRLRQIMTELSNYRGSLGSLLGYDWVSVPLAYTQTVTIAIYVWVGGLLFGRQSLLQTPGVAEDHGKPMISEYFPFFTFFQFIFYVGWLKVGEALINPLCEDDDDFELNAIIDRNVYVGFMLVDELNGRHPEIEKDPFWDEYGASVPYTEAAAYTYKAPFEGSVAEVVISRQAQDWAPEEEVEVDEKGSLNHLAVNFGRKLTILHNKSSFPGVKEDGGGSQVSLKGTSPEVKMSSNTGEKQRAKAKRKPVLKRKGTRKIIGTLPPGSPGNLSHVSRVSEFEPVSEEPEDETAEAALSSPAPGSKSNLTIHADENLPLPR